VRAQTWQKFQSVIFDVVVTVVLLVFLSVCFYFCCYFSDLAIAAVRSARCHNGSDQI